MLVNNNKYLETIESIKQEIANARYKATASVNKELIILYYNIGKIINNHKTWGNKFIESLLTDIALEFPNSKGYSVRNLKYIAKFAELYPDEELAFEMAYSLIDIENRSNSLNQRKGVIDSLENCIQRTFYKNEDDATEYYLNQVSRKKDLGGKYNEKALDSSYDEPSEDDEDEIDEENE